MDTVERSIGFPRENSQVSQSNLNSDQQNISFVHNTKAMISSSETYIIVPAHVQAELESCVKEVTSALLPEPQNYPAYIHNVRQPSSAFVQRSSNNDPSHLPSSFFNCNFGGDGGDDIRPDDVADTFRLEDIGGLEEQKDYLKRSIILPLHCPNFLKEWGVRPPKGILFHGPPGTGKTFMAKSLANELKRKLGSHVNFFYRKGGDVFHTSFGESERKLRQVFDTAKAMSPSVIFFDEIDGLCPPRDGSNHGTSAYSSVVTCFLGQMDGLENEHVFVIAATNRLDAIDPAVRRPGRFDKHLAFGLPDEATRQKIIKIHTSKWSKADQVEPALLSGLAQRTTGFSGADLKKMCEDVVYIAVNANKGVITSNMKVTEDHWIQAISEMKPTTKINIGSALYIPTKPGMQVSQLIRPFCDQVIERISPMLTSCALDEELPVVRKSFLIYMTQDQSMASWSNYILSEILSDPIFNKMSLFELSTTTVTNTVLNGAKPTFLAVIHDVINQAQDAQTHANCSVIVIPNINELLSLAEANNLSSTLVLKAIAKIRGPRMFLLATSSVPLGNKDDSQIMDLFNNRGMLATNPSEEQLTGIPHSEEFAQPLRSLVETSDSETLPKPQSAPDLTKEICEFIQTSLENQNGDQVVAELPQKKLRRRDLDCLQPTEWLDDEVVDFYLELIMIRNRKDEQKKGNQRKKLYCFYSGFYTLLNTEGGLEKVKDAAVGEDIFSSNQIIFPVCHSHHWRLMVADTTSRQVVILDSFQNVPRNLKEDLKISEKIVEYLNSESTRRQNSSPNWQSFPHQAIIPQQDNGYDCGVFILQYAEYLSRCQVNTLANFSFGTEHIPYFRQRMIYECLKCELLT